MDPWLKRRMYMWRCLDEKQWQVTNIVKLREERPELSLVMVLNTFNSIYITERHEIFRGARVPWYPYSPYGELPSVIYMSSFRKRMHIDRPKVIYI